MNIFLTDLPVLWRQFQTKKQIESSNKKAVINVRLQIIYSSISNNKVTIMTKKNTQKK